MMDGKKPILMVDDNKPGVDLARRTGNGALEDLASVEGDHMIGVEHSLLPVCVGVARAGGEAYRGIANGEVDVKVGNKSVHGVGPTSVESEVGCERCVCEIHLHHVQSLQTTKHEAHFISIAGRE